MSKVNARRGSAVVDAGPSHARVRTELLRRLADGRWAPGHLVPPEVDLAAELGVSVGTVRRALEELVDARVLTRRRGSGTYVTLHDQDLMMDLYFHIVRKRDQDREFPQHHLAMFRAGAADADVADRLALKPGAPVYEIETVAELHGKPAVFDRIWLPQKLFPGLTGPQFEHRGRSAFGLYQSHFGLTVTGATECLDAVAAPARIADALGLDRGAPVLRIERIAHGYGGQKIELRRRFVDPSQHAYRRRVGLDETF